MRIAPKTDTTRSAGVVSPQHFKELLTVAVADRERAGLAKPLSHPPKGWEKATAYDVSGGALGVGKHAYVIDGELYLKTAVVRPGAQASWASLGKAPSSGGAIAAGGRSSASSSTAVAGRGSASSRATAGRSSSSSRSEKPTGWAPKPKSAAAGGRTSASSRAVGGRTSASSRAVGGRTSGTSR